MLTVETYTTKDLGESSFLLVTGMKLRELRWEGNICWFVFNDRTSCDSLSKDFWFGQAKVPAKSFYDAMATLKNRIFSGR